MQLHCSATEHLWYLLVHASPVKSLSYSSDRLHTKVSQSFVTVTCLDYALLLCWECYNFDSEFLPVAVEDLPIYYRYSFLLSPDGMPLGLACITRIKLLLHALLMHTEWLLLASLPSHQLFLLGVEQSHLISGIVSLSIKLLQHMALFVGTSLI